MGTCGNAFGGVRPGVGHSSAAASSVTEIVRARNLYERQPENRAPDAPVRGAGNCALRHDGADDGHRWSGAAPSRCGPVRVGGGLVAPFPAPLRAR
jgi:hypothetical protein